MSAPLDVAAIVSPFIEQHMARYEKALEHWLINGADPALRPTESHRFETVNRKLRFVSEIYAAADTSLPTLAEGR